jgi:hypothetical protein
MLLLIQINVAARSPSENIRQLTWSARIGAQAFDGDQP